MSFAIDVNILLYASDQGSPYHQKAKNFLNRCSSGTEIFYLAWTTVMGYLRMTTHGALFAVPLSPDEAMSNIEALIQLPHARLLSEGDGFWNVYREVVRGLAVRGNMVPDAHLASLLTQHGVTTIYSNDADFRKFPFLIVRNPLSEENS